MKKLVVFVIIFLVLLSGCLNDAKETSQNGNFKIEFLFEKDGCKVYRFEDGGHYIYWSNCNGQIQSDTYHSNGKGGGYTERMQTFTTK